MNPYTVTFTENHYHIRWILSGELDWERHDTLNQAEESAKQISGIDEKYIVEQFDKACLLCRSFARSVTRTL